MHSLKASNWTDRGEAAGQKLASTLQHFLGRGLPLDEEQLGHPPSEARHRRLTAIALWHIAKTALVRDRQRIGGRPTEDQPPLPEWLRERLLRE